MNDGTPCKILVLGASGLIGRFVTDDLRARGFAVIGVARRYASSQQVNALDLVLPLVSMEAGALARLIGDHDIGVVVNCIGVLQDAPGHDVSAVHCDFVARLLRAVCEFRRALCTTSYPRITLPALMLDLGARLGDVASWLGWMSPMRTTAITELRRGVSGDPSVWMAVTGVVPTTLSQAVGQRSATIQDKWFARLFLIKALVIASLSVFWIVSGFIALFVSYDAAAAILSSHAFPPTLV